MILAASPVGGGKRPHRVCRTEDGLGWEKVGTSSTKRIVHRLVPHGRDVLLVGGAVPGSGGNAAVLESVTPAERGEKVEARAREGSGR